MNYLCPACRQVRNGVMRTPQSHATLVFAIWPWCSADALKVTSRRTRMRCAFAPTSENICFLVSCVKCLAPNMRAALTFLRDIHQFIIGLAWSVDGVDRPIELSFLRISLIRCVHIGIRNYIVKEFLLLFWHYFLCFFPLHFHFHFLWSFICLRGGDFSCNSFTSAYAFICFGPPEVRPLHHFQI